MVRQRDLRKRLIDHALAQPGAWLDHPWGEDVAKVGKMVFVFFGVEGNTSDFGLGVKLPDSGPLALAQPGCTPMGYGLGKAGWVSVTFTPGMSFVMLRDWIDESYATVAPKKIAASR